MCGNSTSTCHESPSDLKLWGHQATKKTFNEANLLMLDYKALFQGFKHWSELRQSLSVNNRARTERHGQLNGVQGHGDRGTQDTFYQSFFPFELLPPCRCECNFILLLLLSKEILFTTATIYKSYTFPYIETKIQLLDFWRPTTVNWD